MSGEGDNDDSIWPAVDLTDSEDDEPSTNKLPRADPLKCDTLTEDEINGDFPPLIIPNDGSGSDSEEEVVIKKPNPYLTVSGDDVQKKYMSKLRDLHLKRVLILVIFVFVCVICLFVFFH